MALGFFVRLDWTDIAVICGISFIGDVLVNHVSFYLGFGKPNGRCIPLNVSGMPIDQLLTVALKLRTSGPGRLPSFAQFFHNGHWLGKSESNGEAVPPAATFSTWV